MDNEDVFKKSELNELQESKIEQELSAYARMMFEQTPLLIEIWDNNFIPFECNQNILEYYSLNNKEEYKAKMYDFYEYEHTGTSVWRKNLDEIFIKGSGKFDFEDYKPDGTVAHLEVQGVRMKLDGENVVITYSTDVTHLKTLEKEQQRMIIAEESNKAKSKFLARMSHEIRTPITSILGIAEIQLQSPDLSPIMQEAFAKICSSSHILVNIINDILDLSKIEAGKMELLYTRYDTASLISDITHLHLANFATKQVVFNLEIGENFPAFLHGDSLRIRQILNNLLSNAFKYTREGSVTLTFECQKKIVKSEHALFCVSVKDTGMGMTKEQVSTIFNEYSRFHEDIHRHIGGTGLGMSIVHHLVKMMGGKIYINSEVGVGTTINLCIPQKASCNEILTPETASKLKDFEVGFEEAAKKFKITPEPMPYGRVLVVDDIDANLYVAKGLLEFYDLQIETCISGYEAIEKITNGKTYDIIFMDHMMPGIDGVKTMRLMRGLGYTGVIIALTANALIGQSEEFIKNGFDGFISKPIQTKHLNAALLRHIRDKQSPDVIEKAKNDLVVKEGFDDFGSSKKTVTKLRQDFAKSHKNSFKDLEHAIKCEDLITARRIAHTIKGLSGLINETALGKIALDAEIQLAEGCIPSKMELERFYNEIECVINSILPNEQSIANKINDKEKAKELFKKLTPLLETKNSEVFDYINELNKLPETAALVRLIEDIEFNTALKVIDALKIVYDLN